MSQFRRLLDATLIDLDLYALILAGTIFTVLGVQGIADPKTLSSVILAVLAVMAFSQVRTRKQLRIGEAGDLSSLFGTDFPEELYERRASTGGDYTFVGTSGHRTIGTGRRDFAAMAARGASLRFLVLDPDLPGLVEMAARQNSLTRDPVRLEQRIRATLSDLRELQATAPDLIQIRLLPHVPGYGINLFDATKAKGVAFIQMAGFSSDKEPGPIFRVSGGDAYWFRHFVDEVQRLWDTSLEIP